MTPEQLKISILQMAMQGKLVDQRTEEGTAEDDLQIIMECKKEQIKKGVIKKSKTLTPINEDEMIFDIPENWKWIKLGDIASLITKGTTPRGGNIAYLESGIGFLRAENVAGLDVLDKNNLKYIDEETHIGYLKRSIIHANDILITIAGTLGRTGLVREEDLPLNANQAVSMIRLVNTDEVDLKYIIYELNSPEIQKYLTQQKKITAIPNLTLEIIENCICPLPPLEEQHRIVAKIEELLPFVDRYAASYEKIEKLNAKFPEDMKKSILQYAIQGKLVEQRPEEGTAEELYQQIQEEKKRLIKEGKIKKEKPLADITEEEIPFDIPNSWKWVRLGQCVTILGDGLHGTPIYTPNGEYYFINGNNLSDGKIEFKSETKRVSFEEYEKYKKELNSNTVFVSINGTIGNIAFYNNEKIILGKSACYFNLIDSNWKRYMYWLIKTDYFKKYAMTNATGSTIKNVSLATMKSFLVPLPPLDEQHRIVAKIEELLPYCDRLM